ncbi:hypothetical protein GGI25_003424 [Coemansia spiralis]|uniref:Uncharacterized protein n=2 Tax=Coemansia TaxID=4863 RepID=A0A9W8G241_9FUNG|nr:hypothetical protein BX070DRAFT_218129 [Coemansia spiralis]KAJ1994240.1 hypothetical protein EDC05_001682 [Coemansia umbellata]KAJ2676779.1 hypothetical protein GGI25_003424 [Coemansia spiralis]
MVSVFQNTALPAHIIEHVASYVISTVPKPVLIIPYQDAYVEAPAKAFLPLMAVCRAWRILVAPLFYKTVMHTIDKPKKESAPPRQNSERLCLPNIVEIGSQCHVKQLYLNIDLLSLEDGLIEDPLYISNEVFAFFKNCGTLSAAHTLYLFVGYSYTMLFYMRNKRAMMLENQEPDNKTTDPIDISKALDEIKHMVLAAMPRLRRIYINNGPIPLLHDHEKVLNAKADHFLNSFATSLPLGHLSLFNLKVTKDLLTSLETSRGALRSIILSNNKGSQQHVELVRRNSQWLERLHMDHPTNHAVLKLTWMEKGSSTLVYPRLRFLCINSCVGRRNPNNRQPTVDPFPALRTLICHGTFPFSTSIVLEQGKKHICQLEIDLDSELMEAYGNKLFSNGSFEKLDCVMLGWAGNGFSLRWHNSQLLFTKALEIGKSTRVAHIQNMRTDWLDDSALSSITFLDTLRVLDMELTYLTINQALRIFEACSGLQKAYISLCDENERRNECRMPPEDELLNFRKKYDGCKASIYALGIHNTSFPRSRRAGEYILSLVDVLPCLRRVSIAHCEYSIPGRVVAGEMAARKLLRAINLALMRKIYKNRPRVHSVKYVIDNCW